MQKGLAQAVINPASAIGQIISCQGVESTGQEYEYFVVSGSGLTGPVSVSAPPGFVVSTDKVTGFQSNILLTPINGTVNTTVYVHLGATAVAGSISGAITLSATGASSQTVNVSGTVLNTPTVNVEPNLTVLNGATIPAITFQGTANTYTWTNDMPGIGLAANGFNALPSFTAVGSNNATVVATITVTPVSTGAAYVTNGQSGTISVINTLTNVVDATITSGGKEPTSEILSPDGSKLYVLNFSSQSISVINTITNKVLNTFPLPTASIYPYQIALNHDGTQLYVVNYGSNNFSVLDAQTGSLITNLALGGTFPSEIGFSPNGNRFYIGANQNANQGVLLPFNVPGNTPLSPIPVPVYLAYPNYPPPLTYINMVFSPDGTRLYATNGSTVSVINTATQRAIATLPISRGTPLAIAISPDGQRLYAVVTGVVTTNQVQVFNTADNSLMQSIIIDNGIPKGICISPDGTNLYVSCVGSNTIAVINTQTNQVTTNIPVDLSPEINALSIKQGGCSGTPITFTITIKPAPSITASPDNLNAINTIYGTQSSVESFMVSGDLISSGIVAILPPGFEVSLDNNDFSNSVTIKGSGTITNIPIYVRLAVADMAGSYPGDIVLTSPGAANVNVTIANSTVTPASLIITADNKSKFYGAPNPLLTASYAGFKNNDEAAQLTQLPVLNTTALTTSPPGKYPIIASDASSPNYAISYVQGLLTITPNVAIPTAFTPNGDGVNDTWDLQKINDYPNCTVQIFNRYGSRVYYSIGYSTPWDGNYSGAQLPVGTYYYIINLNVGIPILSGYVVLIR